MCLRVGMELVCLYVYMRSLSLFVGLSVFLSLSLSSVSDAAVVVLVLLLMCAIQTSQIVNSILLFSAETTITVNFCRLTDGLSPLDVNGVRLDEI